MTFAIIALLLLAYYSFKELLKVFSVDSYSRSIEDDIK